MVLALIPNIPALKAEDMKKKDQIFYMLVVYNCFAHLFVTVSGIIFVLYYICVRVLSLCSGSNTVFPEAVCISTSLPELSPASPQSAGRDEAIRFF